MATSGTATTDYDILWIVEEAYERAGLELRTAYDLRTAIRSLNLLTMEWANRGLNLWTISSGTVSLVDGTATYSLPADTIDLIEHNVRMSGGVSDLTLTRISVSDYAQIPNKTQEGTPTQVFVRRISTPTITLWPVPNTSGTFTYWRLRRIEDAGAATNTMDIPSRFIPALIAGLAFHIALKKPEAAGRIESLKALYEESFALAADEDRDRGSVFFVPFVGR